MIMCKFKNSEAYIELSIDVFKSKNEEMVRSLKNFLTVLPNPSYIEEILTAAVYQLAEIDADACRWLLRHPSYLMPELDLVELAKNFALKKLQNLGFVWEKDFRFEPSGRLIVNDLVKLHLRADNSRVENLFLEEILNIST